MGCLSPATSCGRRTDGTGPITIPNGAVSAKAALICDREHAALCQVEDGPWDDDSPVTAKIPDGRFLVSCKDSLRLWSLESGKLLSATTHRNITAPRMRAISRSGSLMVTGDFRGDDVFRRLDYCGHVSDGSLPST
jgi:hypothetical protein